MPLTAAHQWSKDINAFSFVAFGKVIGTIGNHILHCLGPAYGSGEAARRFVSFREKVYEPIPEHVGLYEKQYRVFRELYVANERFMI